jgi:hypothetical protein
MLNSDWRNLADNAWEFNLRSHWSSDINNTLIPIKSLFIFVTVALSISKVNILFTENHQVLALLLLVVTLLSIPFLSLVFDIILLLSYIALFLAFIAFVIFCFYHLVLMFIECHEITTQSHKNYLKSQGTTEVSN